MFELNIVADLESIHRSFDWELIVASSMSFHFSGDNLKIFFIVLIFMCGWFGVLSPRCFDPFGKKISFGNLFSSGVLMSAALVHLLGDATSDLDSAPLPKTASGDAYPWGFLVCAISFYFLFIVERLFIGMYMDNIISKKEKENKKKEILNERAHMRDTEILDSNKNKNTKNTNAKKVKNNQNNKHNKSHNSRININNNDNNSSYDDDNKVEYDTSNDNITKLYLNNNDTDNDENIKTTSKKSFESNATNNTSLLGVNANAMNNNNFDNKSGTAYEALLSPNEQDLNDDLTQRNSMDSPQMNIKIEKTKAKNANTSKNNNNKKRKHSSHSSSESSSSDDTDNKGLHMHTHMHTEGPLPHVDDMEIVDLLLSKQYLSAIVLLVGLGIHSFFAGLALGATSSLNVAVTLGIAIVCHKYLAAFALGVPLYKSQQSLCYSVMIATIFGSFTPAGIALGWILENALAGWVTDLLVCIAAGTFLYVSIIEVLIPEFSAEKQMETHVLKENERIKQLRESQFSPFPQPLPFTAYSAPNSPQNKKTSKQQQQFNFSQSNNNSLTSNTTGNTTGNTGINTRTIVAVKRGDNISKTPASARAPISTITEGMNNDQHNVVVDNIQQYEYSSNIAQYGTPNNMSGMGAPGTPLLGSAISMTPTFMLETLKQQSHRQDCLKMTFVITGFAIMSTLAIWV